MKKKISLVLIAISLLWACKKELNMDKFSKDFTITPEIGVPLAIIDMKMSDLLKQDTSILWDPDGFIRFVIRKDSIASFPVDSFVNIPDLEPVQVNNKLGLINIDNTNISESRTLGQMSTNFSSSTKTALDNIAGTVSTFPAINDQNTNVNSLDMNSAQFSSVNIASGFLVLEFRNQLKVTVEQITINIFNTIPFQTLVGQLVYANVGPGSSKSDSINLAGMIMSNNLAYSLPVFKTYTSPAPVLIDLNDGIRFDVTTKDLKASGGSAIFPSKTINPQDLSIDVKADDSTIRIRSVQFESGMINYNVSSNIDEQLSIKITIEGATKNTVALAPVIINVKNETKNGQIDLSDVLFDLTLESGQPYNKMKVKVEPSLISSNTIRNFDSSNYVNANFTFGTLKFKEVGGFLGNREIQIDPSESEFDFLDNFDSGFPLDDPKIKLFTSNSIGVPVEVSLDASGKSSKGAVQNLNAPKINIAYPTLAQKGQVINDTKTIDKTNSSIVAMLNLPPSKITFGGKATLNPGGFVGNYNDFITKGAGIAVGYEIEMPLSLKTNNLVIERFTDNALFEVKGDSVGDFKLGVDPSEIEYMDLILKVDNGIPFESDLGMFFCKKDSSVQDSVVVGMLMLSAVPDANGRTKTNTVSQTTIRLSSEKLQAIKAQNLTIMKVRMTIKTYDNGSTPVKIYSDYLSRIGLSAKVKLKYKVGGKK